MTNADPLDPLIEAAATEIERAIAREMPGLAARARSWLRSLTTTGSIGDYYRHPRRFPMLRLPWWAVRDRAVARSLLADVVRSTMAGYWFIRLLDDLVDGDPRARPDLLPLSALLHLEFQAGYQRHFPPDSPFWELFRTRWVRLADATARPATDASPEDLLARARATIGAVVIPLRALTFAAGVPERFEAWADGVERLAEIEQVIDDLTDWQVDFERGQPNVLVALGLRRGGGAIPAWVVREGFRVGLDLGETLIDRARGPVAALDNGPLLAFLEGRRAALAELDAQTRPGLAQFAALSAVFPERSP